MFLKFPISSLLKVAECIIVNSMPYKCDFFNFLSTFIDGDAIFDALFITCYHVMTFEIIYW